MPRVSRESTSPGHQGAGSKSRERRASGGVPGCVRRGPVQPAGERRPAPPRLASALRTTISLAASEGFEAQPRRLRRLLRQARDRRAGRPGRRAARPGPPRASPPRSRCRRRRACRRARSRAHARRAPRAAACRASRSSCQRSALQRPAPAIRPPARRPAPSSADERLHLDRARVVGPGPQLGAQAARPAAALRSSVRRGRCAGRARSAPDGRGRCVVTVARPLRLVAGASAAKAERSSDCVAACSSPSGQAANGRSTAFASSDCAPCGGAAATRAVAPTCSSASGPVGARVRLPGRRARRRRRGEHAPRSRTAGRPRSSRRPTRVARSWLACSAAKRCSAPLVVAEVDAAAQGAQGEGVVAGAEAQLVDAGGADVDLDRQAQCLGRRRRRARRRAASPGSSVMRSACRLAIVRRSHRAGAAAARRERLPARPVETQRAAAGDERDVDALGGEVAEQRAARRGDLQLRHQGHHPGAARAAWSSAQSSAPIASAAEHQQQRGAAGEPAARSVGVAAAARGGGRPSVVSTGSGVVAHGAEKVTPTLMCSRTCSDVVAVGDVHAQRADRAAVVQADAVAEHRAQVAPVVGGIAGVDEHRAEQPRQLSVSGCSSSMLPVMRTRPPTTASLRVGPSVR